jgi:hypothetical protein
VRLDEALAGNIKNISEDQLQLLCSCSPALNSVSFVMCPEPSASALLPVLQLSALTRLSVGAVGPAAAAAVDFAVDLMRLRELCLSGLLQQRDPALLLLTALTALERLELSSRGTTYIIPNKVSQHC